MTVTTKPTAIVTGAGQGIGRGVALALAAAGVAVAAVGRTRATLDATCEEIVDRGGVANAIVADLADPASADRIVEEAIGTLGPPRILVNNAHEFSFGPLADADLGELERGIASGPIAALRLMRACRPHLRDGGSIVNIGSGAVLAPPMGVGGYAMAKAALHTLTRAAACEWAGDGIRVNLVLPVALTPPMAQAFTANPDLRDDMVRSIPLGRIGDPETDIGPVVAFLCSDAAGYVTGATLSVDGGEAHLR